jgi:hypothetical protein
MFEYCTNLSSISVAFTEWPENATTDWVKGVQTVNGTFYKSVDLSAEFGDSRIPTNWTVIG